MVKKTQEGMTLMSVMIAIALSGIIGLMIIRLMGNQAEAMQVVELRERREHLLQHYRGLIISEWDRSGGGITSKANRRFKDDDMYGTANDSDGWWVARARLVTEQSGWIQHSDVYNAGGTDASSGLHQEDLKMVHLSITFDPDKHPVLSIALAVREEYIYIGSRHSHRDCGSGSELTRLDTTPTSPNPNRALYHPDSKGAVVSYSLHSNYAKCSQVPLVENKNECPPVSGWLGFESRGSGDPFYRRIHGTGEFVTGRIACSYPDNRDSTSNSAKWHRAISADDGPWYRLGRTRRDNSTATGTGNDKRCYGHLGGLSYVDKITAVGVGGTGGGELLCEPTLIAPQVFKDYYEYERTSTSIRKRRSPAIAGSQLGVYSWNLRDKDQPGPLNACYSYPSYNGSTSPLYRHHVGGGGYNVKHSGGLTHFTSTGAGSGARRDPFHARNNSRGVPGDRGAPGDCVCDSP